MESGQNIEFLNREDSDTGLVAPEQSVRLVKLFVVLSPAARNRVMALAQELSEAAKQSPAADSDAPKDPIETSLRN
ncbi:MAG: hypothetical protein EOO23_05145 [Comamonadaceae bacterium]|nr:MAG: hypothetical protein EOO23_05145 [Comamonadaceae bacterium]